MTAQELGSRLFAAIVAENLEQVKQCLADGADASYTENIEGTWGAHDRMSAIHKALRIQDDHNRYEIVELLINNKAKIDTNESHYDWRGCGSRTSALERVLEKKDVNLLKLFLENGANANLQSTTDIHSMRTDGELKRTLLTSACMSNDFEIAKCLLEGKADPNLKCSTVTDNEYGHRSDTHETALHICVESQGKETEVEEIVKCLIDNSADVNCVKKYLVQTSISKPDYALEVDDPRDENYHSGLETFRAEETPVHFAIKTGKSLILKCLVDNGADLNIPSKCGAKETSTFELIDEYWKDNEEMLHKMKFAIGETSLAKSARK